MFWLAGLMGMMVVGSFAAMGTQGAGDGDELSDDGLLSDHGEAHAAKQSDDLVQSAMAPADAPDLDPVVGFDPAQDQLVVVWDDIDQQDPPLLGLRISDTPGMTDILLDGAPVATLPEDQVPPLDQIALLPESVAGGLPD